MPKTTQTFANYELLGLVGEGTFARVYRARQVGTNNLLALKVLRARYSERPDFLARLEREIKFYKELNSDNVPRLISYGEHNGSYFIGLEFIQGDTIAKYLQQKKRLNPPEACNLMIQALNGLQAAHALNIVHRDIKPDNLMRTPQGVLKIMDFGIARHSDDSPEMTKTLGTPLYMSPEAINQTPQDGRADIYSIGAVLFELLTGRPPFQAESEYAVYHKHLSEMPPTLSHLVLNQIIQRAMAKKPEERYQNALAMAAALQQVYANMVPGKKSTNGTAKATSSNRASTHLPTMVFKPPTSSVPNGNGISPWFLVAAVGGMLALILSIVIVAVILTNSNPLVVPKAGNASPNSLFGKPPTVTVSRVGTPPKAVTPTANAPVAPDVKADKLDKPVLYTIKKDDKLTDIANRFNGPALEFGTSLETISADNGKPDPNNLKIGSNLKINIKKEYRIAYPTRVKALEKTTTISGIFSDPNKKITITLAQDATIKDELEGKEADVILFLDKDNLTTPKAAFYRGAAGGAWRRWPLQGLKDEPIASLLTYVWMNQQMAEFVQERDGSYDGKATLLSDKPDAKAAFFEKGFLGRLRLVPNSNDLYKRELKPEQMVKDAELQALDDWRLEGITGVPFYVLDKSKDGYSAAGSNDPDPAPPIVQTQTPPAPTSTPAPQTATPLPTTAAASIPATPTPPISRPTTARPIADGTDTRPATTTEIFGGTTAPATTVPFTTPFPAPTGTPVPVTRPALPTSGGFITPTP